MIEQQISIFDIEPEAKEVRRITYNQARPFLLKIHYARRMPCITHAFGLFINGIIGGGSNIRHTSFSESMRGTGWREKS